MMTIFGMDHVLVFQFLYVLLCVINSYFTFYDRVLTLFLILHSCVIISHVSMHL